MHVNSLHQLPACGHTRGHGPNVPNEAAHTLVAQLCECGQTDARRTFAMLDRVTRIALGPRQVSRQVVSLPRGLSSSVAELSVDELARAGLAKVIVTLLSSLIVVQRRPPHLLPLVSHQPLITASPHSSPKVCASTLPSHMPSATISIPWRHFP